MENKMPQENEKLREMLEKAKKIQGLEIALNALELDNSGPVYSRMAGIYNPQIGLTDVYVDPENQLGIFAFHKNYSTCADPVYSTVFGLYHNGTTQLSDEIRKGDYGDISHQIDKIHRVNIEQDGLEKTVRVVALNEKALKDLKETISRKVLPCYTLDSAEINYHLNSKKGPKETIKNRLAIDYFPDADPEFVKRTIRECKSWNLNPSECER